MADVLLFHHIQGLTPGIEGFADELRWAGHGVHVPDLFHGRRFPTIDEGWPMRAARGSGPLHNEDWTQPRIFRLRWSTPVSHSA